MVLLKSLPGSPISVPVLTCTAHSTFLTHQGHSHWGLPGFRLETRPHLKNPWTTPPKKPQVDFSPELNLWGRKRLVPPARHNLMFRARGKKVSQTNAAPNNLFVWFWRQLVPTMTNLPAGWQSCPRMQSTWKRRWSLNTGPSTTLTGSLRVSYLSGRFHQILSGKIIPISDDKLTATAF